MHRHPHGVADAMPAAVAGWTPARAVFAATILLFVAAQSASPQFARAQEEWGFENVRFRYATFLQEGAGVQSQGRRREGSPRGNEHAWIFQPITSFLVRQNPDTTHNIAIPVDIVTAASTDGLDAVTSESRENEAASIDVVSSTRTSPTTTLQIHWGGHFEEYWGSGFLGASIVQSFAEDNATFRTGVEMIHDSFDAITPGGIDPGPVVSRSTWSVHGAFSQLLSPHTIASAGYTFTGQFGHLETTYNSIPTPNGRLADFLGRTRSRHALTGEIRHAFPETRTFLAADYRFYVDSFDALAHTARATVTQYIEDVWLRAHYRFHSQEAPSFWRTSAPSDFPRYLRRTGDSDLETFMAHEIGASLRWFYDRRGALTANSSFVELGYVYYFRTNSLDMHVTSLDFGYEF